MNPLIWGALAHGPYAVGFRTTIATDYSRLYGVKDAAAPREYRPILTALWYPAVVSEDAVRMTYGDYLSVTTDTETHAEFARRYSAYLKAMTYRYGLKADTGKLTEEDNERFARWEQFSMAAVRNAEPVAQRFPVVLYHPGTSGTYDDNSILCEYLASHGFLVVSSAYQNEDAAGIDLHWDLTRSIKDFSFLLNYLAMDPQADGTQIGVIGQSYGAMAALAWASEDNSPLCALVSLDSTMDYHAPEDATGDAITLRNALKRSHNMTQAMLFIAVQNRRAIWEQWDYLSDAPRWYANTGPLDHNDVTSQGLLGNLERAAAEIAPGLRHRYESVCDLTCRFLKGYLGGDRDSLLSLMKTALATANVTWEELQNPLTLDPPFILHHKPAEPGPTAA